MTKQTKPRKSPGTTPQHLPGTRLVHVRRGKLLARAVVVADGVRYAGKIYASLSGAASAAAKLGKHASVNGHVFWAVKA